VCRQCYVAAWNIRSVNKEVQEKLMEMGWNKERVTKEDPYMSQEKVEEVEDDEDGEYKQKKMKNTKKKKKPMK
jgi:hypothetical protein